MKKKLFKIFLLLLIASISLFSLPGCNEESNQSRDKKFDNITEQNVSHYIADQIYEASIFSVEESVLLLNESIIELCKPQTKIRLMDDLLLAQKRWKEAIVLWRESRSYQISPIKSLYVYRQIDQLPINTTVIDAVLKEPSLHPGKEERTIFGFGSIEYLLFADNNSQMALSRFKEKHNCLLLKEMAIDLTENIIKIKKYWNQAPDGAKHQFKEVTGKFYLDQKEVTTNIVAQMLNSLEMIVWHKIGLPANFFRGDPDFKKLDAWRSQYSLNNIKAIFLGVDKVYGDINTMGLYHLIYAKDKNLANRISDHFDHINSLLDKLTLPIEMNYDNPPDELEAVFHELQELQNDLTEMAKVLELKLVFEEDGD